MRPVPMLFTVPALICVSTPSIRPRLVKVLVALTWVVLPDISPVAVLSMVLAVSLSVLPACSLPLLLTLALVVRVALPLAMTCPLLLKSVLSVRLKSLLESTLPSPPKLLAATLRVLSAIKVPAVLLIAKVLLLAAWLSCTLRVSPALIKPALLLTVPTLATLRLLVARIAPLLLPKVVAPRVTLLPSMPRSALVVLRVLLLVTVPALRLVVAPLRTKPPVLLMAPVPTASVTLSKP